MDKMPSQSLWSVRAVCACLLLASAALGTSIVQDNKVTRTAGVDDTKMGAYRALAQLSFRAFQKGDNAMAAELARILDLTWDKGEEAGGDRSLIKTNKDLFEQIDKAMDGYVNLILVYNPVPPDKANAANAYKDVLAQLKSETMAKYRAEATSTYEALEKDDLVKASKLAAKLLQDWHAGTEDLRKSNPGEWTVVKQSLGLFAWPIATYHPELPDPASLQTAYNNYLEKLKQAD
jgi:hypothetical protein